MKRDLDLQRNILFYVEDDFEPGDFAYCEISIDTYDAKVVEEHCSLLIQAGYINSADRRSHSIEMDGIYVGNLTNAGYDFFDKIRQDTIWNKTKDIIVKKGLPLIPQTIGKIASAIIESTVEGVTSAILKNNGIG